jgi:hypothetical protein
MQDFRVQSGIQANGNITGVNYLNASNITVTYTGLFANIFVSGKITGNVIGTVSSLDNQTTSALKEGSNLYFTAQRAIAALAGNNVTVNNLTVSGDLDIQGNIVSVNTATLNVEDKNILIANGAINAGQADGAGITIAGANATITYQSSPNRFEFNKNVKVLGNITSDTINANTITSNAIVSTRDISAAGNLIANGLIIRNIVVSDNVLTGNVTSQGVTTNVISTTDITTGNINVTGISNAANNQATGSLNVPNGGAYIGGNLVVASSAFVGKDPVVTLNPLNQSIALLRAQLDAPVGNVIYVTGNGNDNNSGNSFANALANIHTALNRAQPWTTVFVKSGDYVLYQQPVTIKRRVGLVGDNLRTTTIRPSNVTQDMFYVENASYATGITFRDHQAPSAVFSYNPDGSAGVITTSPYIQNSSSITTTGTGMRVDGRYVSGLRSMVCDSYTQTNAGGIGIHMLNRGYTQLVSVFTICCDIAILAENGGFCSITNSNSSFGNYGLVARGVSEPTAFGYLNGAQDGREFLIYGLSRRPNYRDTILFANYDQAKCSRDAGLIADSLAIDLAYSSNTQSTFAGLQYWSQTSSAIQNEQIQTVAAITFAKNLAANVVANVAIAPVYQTNVAQVKRLPGTAAANVITEFDLIANIITSGTVGVTDRIIPNDVAVTANVGLNNTANILSLNKTFIAAETVAYVRQTYPGFFGNAAYFIDAANSEATCSRDVGYMIDSINFDLLHGGNRQAIMSGVYYYNYSTDTSQINDQIVATGKSYDFIGELITRLVQNKKNAYYNQEKCERDTGLIVDSILFDIAYGGNTQSTFAALQYWAQSGSDIPNQSAQTIAAINLTKNLATNVASNILVTSTYQANVAQVRGLPGTISLNAKVSEEFNLVSNIITGGTIGVTDRIVRNIFPANADVYVQRTANLIVDNKAFIQAEVIAYINQTWPNFFSQANTFIDQANAQATCSRDVGYLIDSVAFDIRHDGNKQAIQAGTYYYTYNANVTQINNQIVQTGQAYDYIGQIANKIVRNRKNAAYDQEKCERDTGLIVDSIALDLLHNSTSQSKFAGLQYWSQSESAINNQATETIDAINYAKRLASNVAQSISIIVPKQFVISQVSGTAATAAESNVYDTSFDLITNTITNGTVGITDRIIPNGYFASSNVNINNAANLIIANKSFIAAEVIAYVNQTYPGFFANASKFVDVANAETTCSRDVGYILDSITFDLLHGGNKQTIQSAVYYYNYNANVTQINDQIVKTGRAYTFIGDRINELITGNATATYQTTVQPNNIAATRATTAETANVLSKVALINSIITSGPTVAGAKIPIGLTASTNSNVRNAVAIIAANRDYLKAETIGYVNTTLWDPPFQTDVAQNTTAYAAATVAEANLILDKIRLIKNIITNGPSVAPAKTPISYTLSTNANVVNAAKILQINRDYIKAETIAYVNDVLFDPPYQTAVKQNTTAAPAATLAEANIVLNNITLIKNIITNGPTVAPAKRPINANVSITANASNAAKIILANRDYIRAETIAYTNRNWANIVGNAATYYTVAASTDLIGNACTITLLENILEPIRSNVAISFHSQSYIQTSTHTFEYIGSGTDLARALPYNGGLPIQGNEVIETNGGAVYFTSTDQQGDFRIGKGLLFNRVDGTITGRTFNKSLFAVMTPYILAIEG